MMFIGLIVGLAISLLLAIIVGLYLDVRDIKDKL